MGVCVQVVYDRVKWGKVRARMEPRTNGSGRTAQVMVVDMDEVRGLFAAEREAAEKKAREVEQARAARRVEIVELRAIREQELKKPRVGAAAAVVKGAGTKSIKQLARELRISTAEVRRIYEAEGCL